MQQIKAFHNLSLFVSYPSFLWKKLIASLFPEEQIFKLYISQSHPLDIIRKKILIGLS